MLAITTGRKTSLLFFSDSLWGQIWKKWFGSNVSLMTLIINYEMYCNTWKQFDRSEAGLIFQEKSLHDIIFSSTTESNRKKNFTGIIFWCSSTEVASRKSFHAILRLEWQPKGKILFPRNTLAHSNEMHYVKCAVWMWSYPNFVNICSISTHCFIVFWPILAHLYQVMTLLQMSDPGPFWSSCFCYFF